MSNEDFCLKWNDHHQVFFSSAERLCRTDLLTDVTLVCGNKEFAAHKLVLSACSGYFSSLFYNKRGRGSSPLMTVPVHTLIYLKDIDAGHLELILDYMYRGDVSVQQGDLMGLLATAKSLQVKGLTDASTDDVPKTKPSKPAKRGVKRSEPTPDETNEEEQQKETETQESEPKKIKEEAINIVSVTTMEAEGLEEPMPPRTRQPVEEPPEGTIEEFVGGQDDDDEEGIVEEYGGDEMMGEAGDTSATPLGGAFDDDEYEDEDGELGAVKRLDFENNRCPVCLKHFYSKWVTKRHYKRAHAHVKPFACFIETCNFKTDRRHRLFDHCKRKHKTTKEEFDKKTKYSGLLEDPLDDNCDDKKKANKTSKRRKK